MTLKRILIRNRRYILALLFLGLVLLFSLLVQVLPWDPEQVDITNMLASPSAAHWLGTDELGRDYLIRVIYGGRISLLVGIMAMVTSTLLGTAIGLISGYFGGLADTVLMRLVDVLSSIPWMILIVVVGLFLKPGLSSIILVIGCFSWMGLARLIRAETLSIKERDYVVYAQTIQEPAGRIIIRHILPGVIPTLSVAASMSVGSAIMTESALSFLGLGIQQPLASWGSLLQTAQSTLQRQPLMAIIPGLLIMLTVLSFNQLGNLSREVLLKHEQVSGE